ncbi:hypothetical protein [Mycolicibacterium cosmeticum]|uniref:hypothetical protein n=1 Tax=Mycolicibacterium cosmeticum TaxID=258533 RepID=UPI00320476AF
MAKHFGVEVVALPGGEVGRGTLNKLGQLRHPALDAEWIVLCDCDTVFTEPLPTTVFAPGIAAKLVDVGFPGIPFWNDLLGRLGLGAADARPAEIGGVLTYRNNCNGGLYIGDRGCWACIGTEWQRAVDALPAWVSVPASWTRHYDQIAFGVACATLKLDVRLLGSELNFPFHLEPHGPNDLSPVILHHHQSLDSKRLRCRPGYETFSGVMSAVARVNAVLADVDWAGCGL